MSEETHEMFSLFPSSKVHSKPAKKSTKFGDVDIDVDVDDADDDVRVATSKSKSKPTLKGDIQLPKSKREVFKLFDLSTTNQILQVSFNNIFSQSNP